MLKACRLGLLILAAVGLHGQPRIQVPVTQQTISIDGDSTDWRDVKALGAGIGFYPGDGRSGTPDHPGTTVLGTIDGADDCQVAIWMVHDGRYLYVLAEITDDDHEPFDALNSDYPAFREDTLQLYIDSANARRRWISGAPIQEQAGFEQFGVSTDGNIWGENCDFNTSGKLRQPAPQGSAPDGINWSVACTVRRLATGFLYVFEERIALAGKPGANMERLRPGRSYGFNAEFCDADRGTPLEGYIWWSSHSEIDAWNRPALWGTMILAPGP